MQEIYQKIHSAIVSDNVKQFKSLLDANKGCFNLSFGRFPLLSLAYLYNANKIISHFEKQLLTVTEYKEIEEITEDYLKFKKQAQKSLRLYINGQIIAPQEMAAVLGYGDVVNRSLKSNASSRDVERVKKIYSLTHNQEVKKNGNVIIAPRPKKPKKFESILVLCIVLVCALVCVSAVVSLELVPLRLGGDGTKENPIKISTSTLLDIALKEDSTRTYALENNINLNANEFNEKTLNINLDGHNKTVYVNNTTKTLFNNIKGTLSNVTFVFENVSGEMLQSGAFFADTISGKLSNVSFIFNDVNLTFKQSGALVVNVLSGTLENVTLIANGTFVEDETFSSESDENDDTASTETVMATLIKENNGLVQNVNATVNLEISGNAKRNESSYDTLKLGDASIGTIVGVNNGTISNVTVKEGSSIVTDTVDIAGIAVENNARATISKCLNYATLTQTTASHEWHPNIAGITMRNHGTIVGSKNSANITATTTHSSGENSVVLGGIVTNNTGVIDNAENKGDISANVTNSLITIGGISTVNTIDKASGTVTNSFNYGNITANITSSQDTNYNSAIIGGVSARSDYNAVIEKCKNIGNISFTTAKKKSISLIGGIIALQDTGYPTVNLVQNYGNITISSPSETETVAYVGGIISTLFTGRITNSFNAGSIDCSGKDDLYLKGGVIGAVRTIDVVLWNVTWSTLYYVSEQNYTVGVGTYENDTDTQVICTDIDTIKNTEVYWE